MANDAPRYVMRNCNAYMNREDFIGQVSEIQTPNITLSYEGMRNAGMAKEEPVLMGFEVEDADVKMTGLDPAVLPLLGSAIGTTTEFMFVADLRSQDGTMASLAYYVRGHLSEIDFDNWTPGEKASHGFMIKPVSGRITHGPTEVLRWNSFELWRGGVKLFDARPQLMAV